MDLNLWGCVFWPFWGNRSRKRNRVGYRQYNDWDLLFIYITDVILSLISSFCLDERDVLSLPPPGGPIHGCHECEREAFFNIDLSHLYDL